MTVALRHKPRIFALHIRCDNCLREVSRAIEVPAVDDAPCDADELAESGFMDTLGFRCRHCDCQIGRVIGVSQERSYA
ncbi:MULTISPECIES: hypothetical protein [unclassified Ensifer]|uniref:hypothetical protein n=1 Tax=unclassified Ensifer TaxID=2633371 RepID=UPI000813133F|nr:MULTISPECIES: hypothetical protein [unclassified Ensifer]OCP05019.1 hypothetical protein BC362_14785 [Ensifer sp. LC14]OCP11822.1 hypothetical protein BC374_16220 [Ensifer sp. LC13]OCP12378.1 hypothetical protein BBX50_16415 [Ensifer sp. LC11]OCP33654.1 hypothetical protein BC364_15425 [Ensifer sp. LC499]